MKKVSIIFVFVFSLFVVFAAARSQSDYIIGLSSDGSWEWTNGSPTPVIHTALPGPSQTPWIITATPDDFLTPPPTQEIEPTFTPTDVPTCLLQNQAGGNVRVRNLPTTEGTITLGNIEADQYIAPEAYYDGPTYIWWKIFWEPGVSGWTAEPYEDGWYVEIVPCGEVPYENPFDLPHSAALLWHIVPNYNIENVRISWGILKQKGIEFGPKPYFDMGICREALENGGTCIYRHGAPDCPQNIGSADPVESALNFLNWGNHARDTIAGYEKAWWEPLNECNFGGPESDASLSIVYWWAEWLETFIEAAHQGGYPKLVIPTFGPGHGDPVQYRIWKDALIKLDEYGGMMGEHAYQPYLNEEGNYNLAPCDIYLSCRHRLNEIYRQQEGVDIDVAITEAARGWGGDPVDVNDFVQWYEEIRYDDWVHSVSLWTAGILHPWHEAVLDNYVIPIASQIDP